MNHTTKKKQELSLPIKEIPIEGRLRGVLLRYRTIQMQENSWHAHESWKIWLRHTEDERLFFQGIIQHAAASS